MFDREDRERVSWWQMFQAMPRSIQGVSIVVAGFTAIEVIRSVTQMIQTILQPILHWWFR